ncbi:MULTISPECIES: hypothetical protein [Clostridium]|uniref:Predicted membrane protein n=3 Tax=Clostridium acetobutylicum TaxID=1488 RepID=Q97L82_CLOAB|nr:MULTISPECIES: hypothetical protein [Clostridium]AWV80378.1 hypothetical protein DK921_09780 [Clostridium acetobutylicum]AAK78657.1 Predicted membrane protein [Clostridium acetobutylicum ATCC 824]AEI31379.1 hypothetical protein SMB_G0694 [Clostridium acetobutylicum DSM 1731]MBC2392566.1 hypothetical protein [Clostridium acetobutylicum]MBC2583860.1 hypothetical protein [Clostridium acetobutylicum]
MFVYAYILMLLLTVLMCINLFIDSFKCPVKIRRILRGLVFLIMLRYVTLLIMCLKKSITYIYFMRPIVLLDILYIPLVILIMIFVFTRSAKFNFVYAAISGIIFFSLYIFLNFKILKTANPFYSYSFGYLIDLKSYSVVVAVVKVMVLILMLMLCGYFLRKSNIRRAGFCFLMIVILVMLVENISIIIMPKVMPEYLFGEVLLLICLNYMVRLFKK